MNEQQTFERIVAESVSELGPLTATDGAIERTLSSVDRKRQRPRWIALIKEPPMRTNSHLAVGSPAVRTAAILAATLLLAVILAAAGVVGTRLLAAGPIVVAQDGSGTVETLADGLAMAEDGDEILIRPGTYAEAVVIDKAVTLTGDGPVEEIVVSAGTGPLMVITGDAAVAGITFSGPASQGVQVLGGEVTLEDLVFDRVGEPFAGQAPCPRPCRSLFLDEAANAVVRDSQFIDGGQIGVDGGSIARIEGNRLSGGPHIALFGIGPGSVVRNNTIADSKTRAIGLYQPTDVLISGNTLTDNPEYGIAVGWEQGAGVDPSIVANTISGSANGIDVAREATPELERNVLFDNGVGIIIRGSNAYVGDNDLTANGSGIVVNGGSPTLDGNVVTDGAVGLALASVATPALGSNTVCHNDTNVRLIGDAVLNGSVHQDCADTPAE